MKASWKMISPLKCKTGTIIQTLLPEKKSMNICKQYAGIGVWGKKAFKYRLCCQAHHLRNAAFSSWTSNHITDICLAPCNGHLRWGAIHPCNFPVCKVALLGSPWANWTFWESKRKTCKLLMHSWVISFKNSAIKNVMLNWVFHIYPCIFKSFLLILVISFWKFHFL